MLVYGDAEKAENTADLRAALGYCLDACDRLPPGLQRHALLVDALIRAGELAQGLADAAFDANEVDDVSPVNDACDRLLLILADAVVRSWRSGFADGGLDEGWRSALDDVRGEGKIRTTSPEGYTYYALYPECYVEAALASGLDSSTVVIGIRSIGTSLASVVAASLGSKRLSTVRPKGHPFERRIEIAPGLRERVLADKAANFAIVDEGPGLSGTSFGSVADWLIDHGVDEHRLHFFPNHAGDLGSKASRRHKERWSRAHRHHVDIKKLIIAPDRPEHGLEAWVADLVGPLDRHLTDMSGGDWRGVVYSGERAWPPSDRQKEHLKYLAEADGRKFLVKFAGLGGSGQRKLETARRLADAGHGPETIGLSHGFLVQLWLNGRSLNDTGFDRQQLIAGIGDYLGFRAGMLPAHAGGASLEKLFEMAAFNLGESLGEAARSCIKAFLGDTAPLQALIQPVDTDNRMHAWEWRVDETGRLIKTDALDHSSSHDLIGCQDIAWDIAAASVEFDLAEDERAQLADRVSDQSHRNVHMDLLRALEPCYIAFQLGLWTYAQTNAPGESARIAALKARYVRRLQNSGGPHWTVGKDRAPAEELSSSIEPELLMDTSVSPSQGTLGADKGEAS